MRKVIVQEERFIAPFNEPARDLRVLNKPLWLWQRDILAPYTTEEMQIPSLEWMPDDPVETLVYRDNLYFDESLIDEFVGRAQAAGRPRRIAFRHDDPAIATHALPLARGFVREGDLLLADLWYYPRGVTDGAEPLVIDTEPREIGYYHIPTYMSTDRGELVYEVPRKAFVSLEEWPHLYVITVAFGLFARGSRFELRTESDWRFKLRVLLHGLLEQKQVLSASGAVTVGRNVFIDPSATILGPTTIGDNTTIGAGAVIDNSIIGSNVNISQGCQVMLSVVSDGCFLPFRASLFMTSLMEHTIVAQNTCLQMAVIGRNSFIGAGSTFTDYNLLSKPLRAKLDGGLREVEMPVLGGCVGHNCRLGSGLIIYPARTIESDVVLFASSGLRVIADNVSFEESDHHKVEGHGHPRLYPRPDEREPGQGIHPR
jgi:UDP-N-acetylglucosamine diphosphorylase / glucose-1-phosphate thymidylyltransferase / UDP-N-acetylgalactosamine diphosphorylase / glucosamine-1-phosphate N-acetyltransferase / galactosamine-1-phosphate N-acetyltransferase